MSRKHPGKYRFKTDGRPSTRGEGFDELVVDDWLHIECMGKHRKDWMSWWMRVGSLCFWIDTKPGKVRLTRTEHREGDYSKTKWRDHVKRIAKAAAAVATQTPPPTVDSDNMRSRLRSVLESLGLKTGHIKISDRADLSPWQTISIDVRPRSKS
jgi:hypothetical protein